MTQSVFSYSTWRLQGLSLLAVSMVGLAMISGGDSARAQEPGPEPGQCANFLGTSPVVNGESLSGDLDILSWNIQKSSNTGWAEDLATFTSGIDLAFIQEATSEAGIPSVIRTPLHNAFTAGYSTAKKETGVMTLSASSPSMHCSLTAWEPWLGTPKATSVTEYPLDGRSDRLLAVNVHAVNFALGMENFNSQFNALRELLSNHEGPIIFAGDLNTWSETRQALVDAFLGEHGLSPVTFEPDLRTRTFGRALDHIYVRGMQAKAAQVIPVSSSDHNPLRVRLALLK